MSVVPPAYHYKIEPKRNDNRGQQHDETMRCMRNSVIASLVLAGMFQRGRPNGA